MTDSPNTTCPKCKAAVEAGAVFCTACGMRLPEVTTAARGRDVAQAASSPEAEPGIPESPHCGNCQAALEPGAIFCTVCGARATATDPASTAAPPSSAGESAVIPSSAAAAEPALSAASSPAFQQPAGSSSASQAARSAAMAAATQPAYEAAQAPKSSYTPAALGQAPGGRKTGPLVILVLLLLIAVAGAVLWLRPSAPTGKVLILTPESSSVTVEPNSTIQLGVAVHGDSGAGVSWKVQENYGGRVEPAGVTARGEQIIYKAAYHAGGTPGDYHVVATSAANAESRVSITVHVER